MGVHVYLQQGDVRFREFSDPAGGIFDDAADFDALLPDFVSLGEIASEVELPPEAMPSLLGDIDRLLPGAGIGAEHRGLERFRTLAALCARSHDTKLVLTTG